MTIKKALGKNIVVRYLDVAEEITKLIIPDTAKLNMAYGDCWKAEVISAGSKVPYKLNAGQIVAVNKRLGTRLEHGLAIYDPEDVYCIFEE